VGLLRYARNDIYDTILIGKLRSAVAPPWIEEK